MATIDPIEVAHVLMLDAARSVTDRQIHNAIGDHEGSADLSSGEFADLIAQVRHEIYTAEITINTGAA